MSRATTGVTRLSPQSLGVAVMIVSPIATSCQGPEHERSAAPASSTAPSTSAATASSGPAAASPVAERSSPIASSSATPSSVAPEPHAIAELLAGVQSHRADYEGKPIAIDGTFVKIAQGSWGGDYDHPMYFYRLAIIADAVGDGEHTIGCVLGDGASTTELAPGDRVHAEGSGRVKNPIDARGIFGLELLGCKLAKTER